MKSNLKTILLSMAIFLGLTMSATAQVFPVEVPIICSADNHIPKELAARFGEKPVLQGVTHGNLMQVWTNPETGSWTVLWILPDGTACDLASGQSLMEVEPPRGPAY